MTDIDGVLNSVGSFVYNNRLKMAGLTEVPTHRSICPIAASNLLYILEELPDVSLVITSSWRKLYAMNELKALFYQNNLPSDRIVGVTPVSVSRYRGEEIGMYLKEHPEVTDFVILDDDSDMNPYKDRLIKTNCGNGLTFTDAEKVITMFGETNEK